MMLWNELCLALRGFTVSSDSWLNCHNFIVLVLPECCYQPITGIFIEWKIYKKPALCSALIHLESDTVSNKMEHFVAQDLDFVESK